jgi:hypothetical protein
MGFFMLAGGLPVLRAGNCVTIFFDASAIGKA